MSRPCKNPRCHAIVPEGNPARRYCTDECRTWARYPSLGTTSTDPVKMNDVKAIRRAGFVRVLRKHGVVWTEKGE